MRIIFMGTPNFAVPCLEELLKSEDEVIAVFTQPDKKVGRKQILTASPVKELAQKSGVLVYQPTNLKHEETITLIESLQPDLIVVVAYGKILPKAILELPPKGCVNVHSSLLPKYRGAAPIQWSVINGEKITGITTMYMDEGLDTGDMILKAETQVDEGETSGELFERLSVIGAELLLETIQKIKLGSAPREQQNDTEATYAPMLDKSLSAINWSAPAEKIHNLVRGLNPWPVATTLLEGKVLKIYKTRLTELHKETQPGQVISAKPFVVGCGDGAAIEILEVQMESKKRMSAEDFSRGTKVKAGAILE